ncbi:unnamed protein product [Lactuca saligna]|uniref:Agenet domain-containing protein n=1 Tax=Lactuca saligna TaxID=75948 RepID=A0AA35ZHM8_LACSI|nr:unnamed protein product [Lactuca saligna]
MGPLFLQLQVLILSTVLYHGAGWQRGGFGMGFGNPDPIPEYENRSHHQPESQQIVASESIRDTGAVASSQAAEIGLDILAQAIQTSIVFTLEESPRVLFNALAVFALREINLSKSEILAVGMAPYAHLAVYKVCFGLDLPESDILTGLDAAVVDGADVISISIGEENMPFFQDSIAIAHLQLSKKEYFQKAPLLLHFYHSCMLVNAVKFNKYSSVVVSAGYDRSLRAWDCRSHSTEPIRIIDTFLDSVMSICLTKTEIIAGSVDGTVRTFEIRNDGTFERSRKRGITVFSDYAWSSGDQVDVWVQDSWHEAIVMDTNKIDLTSLTVQFPAQSKASIVRSWHVRPTLVWKDDK